MSKSSANSSPKSKEDDGRIPIQRSSLAINRQRQPREQIDYYLDKEGFYRKRIPRDESSLFRVVAEQVFHVQIYFTDVRAACVRYLERHKREFSPLVEGDYEEYLERMKSDKTPGTQLEMRAMSGLYERNFLIFHCETVEPQTLTMDESYEKNVLLFFGGGNHYDSIISKEELTSAGIAQAIVYKVLYGDVFGMGDSIDTFSLLMLTPQSVADMEQKDRERGLGEPDFDQESGGEDQERPLVDQEAKRQFEEHGPPFPYKIVKSFQPHIYRNVAFDTWMEDRKEMFRLNSGQVYSHLSVGAPVMVTFPAEEIASKGYKVQPGEELCGWVQEVRGKDGPPDCAMVYLHKLTDTVSVSHAWITPAPDERELAKSRRHRSNSFNVGNRGQSGQYMRGSNCNRRGRPHLCIPPRDSYHGSRFPVFPVPNFPRGGSMNTIMPSPEHVGQAYSRNDLQYGPIPYSPGQNYVGPQGGMPFQWPYPHSQYSTTTMIAPSMASGPVVAHSAGFAPATCTMPMQVPVGNPMMIYDPQTQAFYPVVPDSPSSYVQYTPVDQGAMMAHPGQQPYYPSQTLQNVVFPYPEVISNDVNWEAQESRQPDLSDILSVDQPTDTSTVQFFYNTGVRYARFIRTNFGVDPRVPVLLPASGYQQPMLALSNTEESSADGGLGFSSCDQGPPESVAAMLTSVPTLPSQELFEGGFVQEPASRALRSVSVTELQETQPLTVTVSTTRPSGPVRPTTPHAPQPQSESSRVPVTSPDSHWSPHTSSTPQTYRRDHPTPSSSRFPHDRQVPHQTQIFSSQTRAQPRGDFSGNSSGRFSYQDAESRCFNRFNHAGDGNGGGQDTSGHFRRASRGHTRPEYHGSGFARD